MKVKLTSDVQNGPFLQKAGWVVDVSDTDGAALVAAGHIEMHPETPARKNPENYDLGCLPIQTVPEPRTLKVKK